jgi:hypothetical protein
MSDGQVESVLMVVVAVMNAYWTVQVLLHVLGVEYSEWMVILRKVVFLVYVHLLFAPSFRILMAYLCAY